MRIVWTKHNEPLLWFFAIALYGVGDLLTTYFGLSMGLVEAGPVMAILVENYGQVALLPAKILILFAFWGLSRVIGIRYSHYVPISLILGGIIVIVHNIIAIQLV